MQIFAAKKPPRETFISRGGGDYHSLALF